MKRATIVATCPHYFDRTRLTIVNRALSGTGLTMVNTLIASSLNGPELAIIGADVATDSNRARLAIIHAVDARNLKRAGSIKNITTVASASNRGGLFIIVP